MNLTLPLSPEVEQELFASPYISVKHAGKVMNVSFKSAARTVSILVEAGILREIPGQQRNRIYCADPILKLLDQPLTESIAVASFWRSRKG